MPLQYDDIPGSWGDYSRHWPYYQCRDEAHAKRVYAACSLERVVPYGSYVQADLHLRVENTEHLVRLTEHMRQTKVHDVNEIIRMYKDVELPVHCYEGEQPSYFSPDAWAKLQRLREEIDR